MNNSINIDFIIQQLNNNRVLGGITMLTMNIFGRYFITEFPSSINIIAQNKFIRLFIIFSFCFIATRHILYSILFLIIILILSKFLLNDKSISYIFKNNIVENNEQNIEQNNIITENDYKKALFIIDNYNKNKK